MMIWRRAARLMPPMTATGVARMSGHGVATARTASTRKPVATRDVRDRTDDECGRRKPHGVPICDTLKRRLARLCRTNERNDPRVLAFAGDCHRANRERSIEVRAAAHQLRGVAVQHHVLDTNTRWHIEVTPNR